MRRKFVVWVLLPLTILAVLGLVLPFVLGQIDYKALLIDQVEAQLHRKVEIGSASYEIFPHVRISLENVLIRDRNGEGIFLSVDRIFADLRIFPLLKQKVVVKRFLLDRPRLSIKREADGTWSGRDLLPLSPAHEFTIAMLGDEIRISNAEINLADARANPGHRLTLRQVNFSFKAETLEYGFRFSGTIPSEKGESSWWAIARLPKGRGSDRVEGRVEAKAVRLQQLAPWFRDETALAGLRAVVDLAAGFEYRWAKEEDSVILKEINLKVLGATVTGSALVKGVGTADKQFTAAIATTPFRLEALINSLSPEVLESYKLGFLHNQRLAGPIRILSLRASKGPGEESSLMVHGQVELLGASATVGKAHVPISDVRGLLRLDADRVLIERLTGRYGEAEVAMGRGEINHLMEKPELFMAARGKMSAQELAVIIARFAPPAVLPRGPAGLKDFSGDVDATVLLQGPLDEPEDLQVEWSVEVHDIGFTDDRVTRPISDLQGTVRSSRRSIIFEQLRGSLGKAAFVLNGDIVYPRGEPTKYDLKVSGRSEIQELLRAASVGLPDSVSVEGPADFAMTLAGSEDHLRGTGSIDLRQVTFGYGEFFTKAGASPGVFEATVLWEPGRRLRVERALLDVTPLTINANGVVNLETQRLAFHVRVPPVAFTAFPKGMLSPNISLTAGSFQADISVRGPMENWRDSKVNGRAAVRGAAFRMERVRFPVEDLTLELHLEDERLLIERATLKIEESRINATGLVRGWRGVPQIELVIDSAGLDLDLLIPRGERSPIRLALEAISRETKLSGRVSVRKGFYHEIQFEELEAKLLGGDGAIVLDPIRGRSNGGTVNGQTRITLAPEKPVAFESSLRFAKVGVEPMLSTLGVKESPVTGLLDLEGALRGESGTLRTLNGDLRIMIQKGHFEKYSATAKIIGLLNLPTLLAGKVDLTTKGMPFNCITSYVVIENGLANVKEYVVDSPIMKITAVGTYDIPNNETNLVMAVSPFGSYEEFLKSIPLFGMLFVGERQGLVTAFFQVKGSIENPKVVALPVKSVSSGVEGLAKLALDVMKNFIFLPQELLSRKKKEASPCPTS